MIPEKPIKMYNLLRDEMNAELFCFLEQTGIPDISDVMENDPDMLNLEGNRIYFVEFDTDESRWVVYLDSGYSIERERIEKILLSFFSKGWEEHFERRQRSWEEFSHGCIAYRGSQGVFYEIWKYRDDKNKMRDAGRISSGSQSLEIRNLKIDRSKERAGIKPTPDSLSQLTGKAGESSFPVSQGQAPRGSLKKIILALLRYFFQETLTHPESSPHAALQLDKAVRQVY